MHSCRICSAPVEPFMSFGRMPIANGFLSEAEFDDEYFFELRPAFCDACGMFQIVEQPEPARMFHENYAFFSGTSRKMAVHFEAWAQALLERCVHRQDPFIVEIGSNDGILLRHFAERGIRHLGIEPSANVAAAAREAGVNTVSAFFDAACAERIVDENGKADFVLAANVMCHIPDFNGVADGMRRLLADDGVLTFEDPYLGAMVDKTSYDQIYDEHVFIFSATAIRNVFARHGLELIGLEPQKTHGGSMRYLLAHQGRYEVGAAVARVLDAEARQGLGEPETYDRFRANCERSRERLTEVLHGIKAEGKRVAGYGATSKSTTVTNYCGITPDLVAYISDTTPGKQGKYSPGVHIPVRPHDTFAAEHPDYALLFAWNHEAEIREKERAFPEAGGRWIRYVPEVEVTA